MQARYTDIDSSKNGALDFVLRKRKPSVAYILSLFVIVFTMLISVTMMTADRIMLVTLVIATVVATGWYVLLQLQRTHDLLLATEFQNALFASALGINNKFCMIMKHDGNIVYLDRSFQGMFPDFLKQSRRTLDMLMEIGAVSKEDIEKIYAAIGRGVFEKVIFNIKSTSNEMHKIVMSVEPILRPSGFVLLRGREFVEARASAAVKPSDSPVSRSNVTLFSHVLDSMDMGVYMTGPSGVFVYINRILEEWLGFTEGEIFSSNLALNDIIYHNSKSSGGIVPDNFEGELLLQKKNGGFMKVFVNQKVIKDDTGKLLGCTAIVHNYAENSTELKKKLW
jgi:two-component system cell cycle sensor histidine kinase/response regulator CckA